MNIKKIIREEITNTEEDWAWTNDVPELINLKPIIDKYVGEDIFSLTTIYYFPYITEKEYVDYVEPTLEYWFPNYKIINDYYNGIDHTEILNQVKNKDNLRRVISAMVYHFGTNNEEDFLWEMGGKPINGRELFNIPDKDIEERINQHREY